MIVATNLIASVVDFTDLFQRLKNDPHLKRWELELLVNYINDSKNKIPKNSKEQKLLLSFYDQKGEPTGEHLNAFLQCHHAQTHEEHLINLLNFYLNFTSNIFLLRGKYIKLQYAKCKSYIKDFELIADQNTNHIISISPLTKLYDWSQQYHFDYSDEPILDQEDLRALAQCQINNFCEVREHIYNTITEPLS